MGRHTINDLRLFSMQELAGRISRKFWLNPKKVGRVLQTWVSAGVVVPDGDIHQGPGIYRKFQEAELYKAALLFPLLRYSVPIHQLQAVRRLIDTSLKKRPNIFREALGGEEWYFHFTIFPMGGVDSEDPKAAANWGEFYRKPYGDKSWGKWFEFTGSFKSEMLFDIYFTVRVDYVLGGL